MPMRGSIDADYSKFVDEAAKAEAGLAKIAAQGKITETSLVAMENSVASGKVSDAIAKTVASVDKAGTTAKASASSFGQLADAGRVADKTLNQFGISLGPTIGSLDEMAKISTQTTGSLGTLGTAASVAGAALAGWNVGRWIAEMTGSDKIIGDLTASMLGLVDASQVAKNNGDVLARAYIATGKVFTDVHLASEALRKASIENAMQSQTTAAMVTAWTREIEKAKGGAAALRGEITAGNLTVAEMETRFNVSARAIDFLKRNLQLAKEETEAKARADETAAKAAKVHADEIKKLQDSMFGTDAIAKSQQYLAALGSVENLTRMNRDAQAAMNTTLGDAIEAYKRMGDVAPAAINQLYVATIAMPPVVNGLQGEWVNVGKQVTITADKVLADIKRMSDDTKAYEAETQRLADEWNKVKPPIAAATDQIQETTAAQQQLTVALHDFGGAAMTAYEQAIAGAQQFAAYAKAGIATSGSIGLGGYEFAQLQATGVPGASSGGAQWADRQPASSQPWGNQNSLTVNVNNADAGQIADKLVGEMKRNGYRL